MDPAIWVSPHFRWDEARCNDGTRVPARYKANVIELMRRLELVRDYWDMPVTLLSCYRTEDYNRRIGGAKASQHLLGKAGDIVIAGTPPAAVYTVVDWMMKNGTIPDGGLGKYKTFTHIDIGPPRRWRG